MEITNQQAVPYGPVMFQSAAKSATPIETGQIEIIARIEAVFEYNV